MRALNALKIGQYRLRQWVKGIFVYPKQKLSLTELDYDDYWDQKRPQENAVLLSPMEGARATIIASHLKREAKSIGDIGAGPGVVLKAILKERPDMSGIAYDSSLRARAYAKALGLRAEPLDLRTDEALTSILPADYYLVLEVLEHIPNSEHVLATLYSKASYGVFFSVPNTGFFMHRFRLLFGKVPAQWIHIPNEHLRFWTIVDMRWWLAALGYQHFKIIPYGGVSILNKLWPNLFAMGMVVEVTK
jgi:2-polyprenyl-3-methyl-5-hydroxy-6-metoxy-1,4-benzoquinol methylase